jgi:hypothetical protein
MSLVLSIVNAWGPSFSRLQQSADFGLNPGALRMFEVVPVSGTVWRQGQGGFRV